MTQPREIERILDHWLTEGPNEVPDRVLDAVVDRIERQPQRPAWRVHGDDRQEIAGALAAIAAVIVVAVVGINLLQAIPNGIGGSSPTPSPSPTSTAALPSPKAPRSLADELGDSLDPGTYLHDRTAPTVTFTIPAGWWLTTDFEPGFGIRPQAYETDEGLRVWYDMRVTVNDAECTEAPDPAIGHTAADLIAAFTTRPGVVATDPKPISIGGLDGEWVDLHLSPDWTATCPFDPSLGPSVTLFTDEDPVNGDNTPFWGVANTEHLRIIALDDRAGSAVLIVVNAVEAAFDALIGESMPVIDTFEFDVAP